jgi:hypothetical protein
MHAPLRPSFQAEWCGLAALKPIAAEWRVLAARAIEPNVFYAPAFALAAAPVFGAGAGAVLVRTAGGRRAGLFPARMPRWRAGLHSMLVGWTHPFGPLGTPLVDHDEPEAVIATWLGLSAAIRRCRHDSCFRLFPSKAHSPRRSMRCWRGRIAPAQLSAATNARC